MNRHLNNHNEDLIQILQQADKQFPVADLGTEGIPLDVDHHLWQLSLFRKAGARCAFEWIRDRLEASLKLGYEPEEEPAEPQPAQLTVADYLESLESNVQQTEDPGAP